MPAGWGQDSPFPSTPTKAGRLLTGGPGPTKPLGPGTCRSVWDVKQQFTAEKTPTNGLVRKKHGQGSGIRIGRKN